MRIKATLYNAEHLEYGLVIPARPQQRLVEAVWPPFRKTAS